MTTALRTTYPYIHTYIKQSGNIHIHRLHVLGRLGSLAASLDSALKEAAAAQLQREQQQQQQQQQQQHPLGKHSTPTNCGQSGPRGIGRLHVGGVAAQQNWCACKSVGLRAEATQVWVDEYANLELFHSGPLFFPITMFICLGERGEGGGNGGKVVGGHLIPPSQPLAYRQTCV
eukprot:1137551-Pelagomonas_calceolata.AAC.1